MLAIGGCFTPGSGDQEEDSPLVPAEDSEAVAEALRRAMEAFLSGALGEIREVHIWSKHRFEKAASSALVAFPFRMLSLGPMTEAECTIIYGYRAKTHYERSIVRLVSKGVSSSMTVYLYDGGLKPFAEPVDKLPSEGCYFIGTKDRYLVSVDDGAVIHRSAREEAAISACLNLAAAARRSPGRRIAP